MSGNSEARSYTDRFQKLALTHIDSVYRLALFMAKNEHDAQNLVQETYLKAYKSFRGFEAETICKAWLLGILSDTLVKVANDTARVANNAASRDQFGDDIIAAINELPVQYKAVILLADVEGIPYSEIASIIGCSMEIVMSRLCTGRRLLGKGLQDMP